MIRKKIILTFDYELFFGKECGTLDNCILKPTDKIIEVCKKNHIRTTFFVDVLYYQKLLEFGLMDQAMAIKKQLQRLIKNSHRIELHLHPHWLDATWDGEKWLFKSYRYYRLHNLHEKAMKKLFRDGVKILQDIAKPVDENYKVLAFRAGGWCIQPFQKLRKAFLESGIKVDSSVAYGIKGQSAVHRFDFTDVPDKNYYFFSENIEEENKAGEFLEIPITTYKKTPKIIALKVIKKMTSKFIKSKKYRIFGDGTGIPMKRTPFHLFIGYNMFTLEGMHPFELKVLLKESQKKLVNFISHPKGMSLTSIDTLQYLNNFDCITLKDVYDNLAAC